ncbi:MAG: exodeoxyribonuclease III [Nanoarchaeota archaeon]|nr:exodeoxyribonuclease III [Nanoarchaeota archaeon]
MRIVTFNVNGMRASIKSGFKDFFDNEEADLVCLQEVKAKRDQVEMTSDGYTVFWNAAEKPGYSGTAIFTKVKPLKATYDIGVPEHDKEGRVITLEFEDFFLVNVYVPNSGVELKRLPYRGTWDNAFTSYLKKLDKQKPVILCGDLNVAHTDIDLKNAKANYNKTSGYTQQEIDGFEALLNEGFVDVFRQFNKEPGNYTYWSYRTNARATNAGWRIDYFIASKRLMPKIKKCEILSEITGSDHCPVRLTLS